MLNIWAGWTAITRQKTALETEKWPQQGIDVKKLIHTIFFVILYHKFIKI